MAAVGCRWRVRRGSRASRRMSPTPWRATPLVTRSRARTQSGSRSRSASRASWVAPEVTHSVLALAALAVALVVALVVAGRRRRRLGGCRRGRSGGRGRGRRGGGRRGRDGDQLVLDRRGRGEDVTGARIAQLVGSLEAVHRVPELVERVRRGAGVTGVGRGPHR